MLSRQPTLDEAWLLESMSAAFEACGCIFKKLLVGYGDALCMCVKPQKGSGVMGMSKCSPGSHIDDMAVRAMSAALRPSGRCLQRVAIWHDTHGIAYSKYVVILHVVTACPAGAVKLSMQLSACICEATSASSSYKTDSGSLAATQKSFETHN